MPLMLKTRKGFSLPLSCAGGSSSYSKLPLQAAERRLANQDLAGGRDAAQARAGVRGVPDHGVRERLGAADVAGDHRPGVDADADRQRRQVALSMRCG